MEYRFAVGYAAEYPDFQHLHLHRYKMAGETAEAEFLFINPREFLADLVVSVEGQEGFANWVASSTDPEALERAQPYLMECESRDIVAWR